MEKLFQSVMMKFKIIVSAVVGLCILFSQTFVYANDEFKQWMQQQSAGVLVQKKEFQIGRAHV